MDFNESLHMILTTHYNCPDDRRNDCEIENLMTVSSYAYFACVSFVSNQPASWGGFFFHCCVYLFFGILRFVCLCSVNQNKFQRGLEMFLCLLAFLVSIQYIFFACV